MAGSEAAAAVPRTLTAGVCAAVLAASLVALLVFSLVTSYYRYQRFSEKSAVEKKDDYLTARNTQHWASLGLSFYASGMGSWLLFAAPESGMLAAWLGVAAYGAANAAPFWLMAYFGPKVKNALGAGRACGGAGSFAGGGRFSADRASGAAGCAVAGSGFSAGGAAAAPAAVGATPPALACGSPGPAFGGAEAPADDPAFGGAEAPAAGGTGFTISDFAQQRFGRGVHALIGLASVFFMGVFLSAELTSIGSVFQSLQPAFPVYAAVIPVSLVTMAYTLVGGAPASIGTDRIQGGILAVFAVAAVAAALHSVGPRLAPGALAAAGAATTTGANAVFVLLISTTINQFLDHGMWLRVFAARSDGDLRRGLFLGGALAAPTVALFGSVGVVAAAARISGLLDIPPGLEFTAFFTLLTTGLERGWLVLTLVFGVCLVTSTVDSLQTGLLGMAASFPGAAPPSEPANPATLPPQEPAKPATEAAKPVSEAAPAPALVAGRNAAQQLPPTLASPAVGAAKSPPALRPALASPPQSVFAAPPAAPASRWPLGEKTSSCPPTAELELAPPPTAATSGVWSPKRGGSPPAAAAAPPPPAPRTPSLWIPRVICLLVNAAATAVSLAQYSVLSLFLTSNIISCAVVPCLFLGFHRRITQTAALAGFGCGLLTILACGWGFMRSFGGGFRWFIFPLGAYHHGTVVTFVLTPLATAAATLAVGEAQCRRNPALEAENQARMRRVAPGALLATAVSPTDGEADLQLPETPRLPGAAALAAAPAASPTASPEACYAEFMSPVLPGNAIFPQEAHEV